MFKIKFNIKLNIISIKVNHKSKIIYLTSFLINIKTTSFTNYSIPILFYSINQAFWWFEVNHARGNTLEFCRISGPAILLNSDSSWSHWLSGSLEKLPDNWYCGHVRPNWFEQHEFSHTSRPMEKQMEMVLFLLVMTYLINFIIIYNFIITYLRQP